MFSKKQPLFLAGLAVLTGASCSRETPQPPPPPSPVAHNPLLVQPFQGQGTTNPAEIFGEGSEAPKPYVPEL